jgi:uncharacterized protein YcbK (DUF882 family)
MHRLQAKDGFEVVRGLMTDDPARPFAPGSPDALHTLGKAIDLRAPGVALEHLLAEFANFFDGGVGLYRQRNFVHVDTGPRRVWDAT